MQLNLNKFVSCRVCQIGACVLSITKFKNKLTFEDIKYTTQYQFKGSAVNKMLVSVFTPKQLALIEYVFEENPKDFNNNNFLEVARVGQVLGAKLTNSEIKKCSDFQEKHGGFGSKHVIIATMKNIIANKGSFKL